MRHSPGELSLSVPSTVAAIDPLCERIHALLAQSRLEDMQFRVEILARECLNNAILHGNRGRKNGWVKFGIRIGKKLICLRVADRGPGFKWRDRCRLRWPGANAVKGRGLMIFKIYADRVAFNRRGNQVTLWINTAKEGR